MAADLVLGKEWPVKMHARDSGSVFNASLGLHSLRCVQHRVNLFRRAGGGGWEDRCRPMSRMRPARHTHCLARAIHEVRAIATMHMDVDETGRKIATTTIHDLRLRRDFRLLC